jgi:hypothetical protein
MTQREILEIDTTPSSSDSLVKPIIDEMLSEDSDLTYMKINHDEDPWIVKMFVSSLAPTATPMFIGFVDGRISGAISGAVSKQDLKGIIN